LPSPLFSLRLSTLPFSDVWEAAMGRHSNFRTHGPNLKPYKKTFRQRRKADSLLARP